VGQIVRLLMGVRYGTYYARKTEPNKPEGLQAAVARVLDNGKGVHKHLKRSLGTKDVREANIRAKPVLAEFDRIKSLARSTAVVTVISDLRPREERMACGLTHSPISSPSHQRIGAAWISIRETASSWSLSRSGRRNARSSYSFPTP
jgi:uncharacterized protein DUF6538